MVSIGLIICLGGLFFDAENTMLLHTETASQEITSPSMQLPSRPEIGYGGPFGIGLNIGREFGLYGLTLRGAPLTWLIIEGGVGYMPVDYTEFTCPNCHPEEIRDSYQVSGKISFGSPSYSSRFQPRISLTSGYDRYRGTVYMFSLIFDYFLAPEVATGFEIGIFIRPQAPTHLQYGDVSSESDFMSTSGIGCGIPFFVFPKTYSTPQD